MEVVFIRQYFNKILKGNFALWAGLFSSTDCTLMYMRNKEDAWNPIAAGFITGGLLAFRGIIDEL